MSIQLGVSQIDIYTKFYMTDIPKIGSKKIKKEKINKLESLHLLIASNNRSMSDEDYKSYSRELTRGVIDESVENEFNRNKFEELRALTNTKGINKA